MKKAMDIRIHPAVNGVCDTSCLDLGNDTGPQQTVTSFLQRIDINQTTYENASPLGKRKLLLQRQVKYVDDIIVTR